MVMDVTAKQDVNDCKGEKKKSFVSMRNAVDVVRNCTSTCVAEKPHHGAHRKPVTSNDEPCSCPPLISSLKYSNNNNAPPSSLPPCSGGSSGSFLVACCARKISHVLLYNHIRELVQNTSSTPATRAVPPTLLVSSFYNQTRVGWPA